MHPKISQKTMQALSALLLLLLTACGSAKATPTVSVDAIYTAAYNTMVAVQATQMAQNPPTSTPTPTLVPTLAPPPTAASLPTLALLSTPTAGGTFNTGGGACDSSAFVADVTIPDNTAMDPGKAFTKTWSLLNNGSCTWSTSYSLQFDSGDQMGGATVAVPASVAPGSTVSISVKLTAPSSGGTFKGTWQLHNAGGQAFGDKPYVIIKVGNAPTVTPGGPTLTPTATVPTARGGFSAISGTLINVPDCQNVSLDISANTATDPVFSASGGDCTYYFTVKDGWSGTITPSRGAWTFVPGSLTFKDVNSDKTGQNFTGTPGTK